MLDKQLVDRLHQENIINKNSVLWWQLGFEGRRVYSEKEFSKNLRTVKYQTLTTEALTRLDEEFTLPKPEDFQEEIINIWVEDEVPILLRNLSLAGFDLPVFTTVKPMSHKPRGWRSLRCSIESELPGMVYEQPHIRGIVIDLTEEFLFFYPFLLGERHEYYSSRMFRLNSTDVPIIIDPIHPTKFHTNLIEKEWKGKRAQKKPSCFDLKIGGYKLVPFFEFDVNRLHTTIYPLPVFQGNLQKLVEDLIKKDSRWAHPSAEKFLRDYHPEKIRERLDLPVVIASSGNGNVELLGAGYAYSDQAFYWPFDKPKHDLAAKALKLRLGLDAKFS